MKTHSKNQDITEFMDAPCLCNCGNWFDLNDGYPSHKPHSNAIVCDECHEKENRIVDIQTEIESLEEMGNKKREIKKLKKELLDLGIDNDSEKYY